uniref:Uncharacterized protein n=1 Tax=Utricularia reniformis TaxID=192314 RepID=A0A1Y0B2V2_9LAMI|nr:hypothetical protein AEK19_MT1592 [Utricularia reniformis]ART31775.1 hypothetical protein AEK19_MT1592 [Utricularia reniformis]
MSAASLPPKHFINEESDPRLPLTFYSYLTLNSYIGAGKASSLRASIKQRRASHPLFVSSLIE